MKKIFIYFLLAFSGVLFTHSSLKAQGSTWVQQVIIGNGGLFEPPPYTDYVTMEKYDPVTHVTNTFNTIYTQSVQDLIIVNSHAYVAAEDSIVEYDLDTYQRVAAVADSGLDRLGFYNNKLIVTKQFPVKRFFVEILDANNNLGLLSRVENIPGDCGGVATTADSVYVAVNGGFLGTKGKMVVINPTTWTVTRVINFDTAAVGINDLYRYGTKIYSVNETPFNVTDKGSFSSFDVNTSAHANYVFNVKVGKSLGIISNLLYVKFNDGVGSFNLNTNSIVDTTLIPKPTGSSKIAILAGAVDPVNNRLYVNIGNELVPGIGVVTTLTGDSVTSFSEGIAADVIALDVRTTFGINNKTQDKDFVTIYPNPAGDFIFLKFNRGEAISNIAIYDITGQKLMNQGISGTEQFLRIDCANLPSGIYFLSVTTDNGLKTKKFIKK
jgi:hypothetical protein